MKTRIIWGLLGLSFVLWSCDEPLAFDNKDFIYNPFTIVQDTLNNIDAIRSTEADIDWGSHLGAWVGETKYYKSGFSMDFVFGDSLHDGFDPDSVRLQIMHQRTFPENGTDTLANAYVNYGFYNTTDQILDMSTSSYGLPLSVDTMNVVNDNTYWTYTLPTGIITAQDSVISLGIFPEHQGQLSVVYGNGSSLRPEIVFFFHEPDTAGNDSITSQTFLADTMYMYLQEKSAAFDKINNTYLSQLSEDSVIIDIDLAGLFPGEDTLVHIISSSLLFEIDKIGSAIYRTISSDSTASFNILATEEVSGSSINIKLGEDYSFLSNEIRTIIQSALDADRSNVSIILKPNHVGYDPGFVAISNDILKSKLYVNKSLAVRP
ncbi:MAG: hypothetical protein K9N35_09480 [Candidatus Marinimicrobia bacterium]|nr:hypothetical protein [Candidatus Neomarinimicrobiota bacterium]